MDERIVAILRSVPAGDWNGIREKSKSIKQSVNVVHGNRRDARAANAEGLTLLNSGDFVAAIEKFQESVRADTGDVEARNNLAYSQIKAGRNDDAIATLSQLLLVVPDRTSAWANLSEAMVGNNNFADATSALKLAVFFSSNRERTITFLNQAIESHDSQAYRGVVTEVMQDLASIPADGPLPAERKVVASRAASPQARASTAGGNARAQEGKATAIEEAQRRKDEATIAAILGEGEGCFAVSKFDCAISSANAALRINQQHAKALSLRDRAMAGQRKALEGIRIQ